MERGKLAEESVRESQTLLKFGHHGNTARLLVGLAGAAAT